MHRIVSRQPAAAATVASGRICAARQHSVRMFAVDTSGHGVKSRIMSYRRIAAEQSVKYIRQLDKAPSAFPLHEEPDSALLKKETRLNHVFRHPELNKQKPKATSSTASEFAEVESEEDKMTC